MGLSGPMLHRPKEGIRRNFQRRKGRKLQNPDSRFMSLALNLARKGGRDVAPNPMVGAVVVKNGKIIGKGYHKKFGGPHAEVIAINSVRSSAELKGATIYVTLEPCRHFGKTPPCLPLIEAVGISRVVCGSHDPFRKISKLQNPKTKKFPNYKTQKPKIIIEFLKGKVADDCGKLNKFFFTWVMKKRPFVTVKIAMSADGFVAGLGGKPIRITSTKQDREVHKLRASHQAIMVGINTILNDDPQLNVRGFKGRDPLRVILDSELKIPKTAKALKDKNYLIATCKKTGHRGLNIWVSQGHQININKLLRYLGGNGISSVLVEPGPTLYRSLKEEHLIDELIVYRSPKRIGKGLKLML